MRVQDNTGGRVQVEIEKYLLLPDWLTAGGGRRDMSRARDRARCWIRWLKRRSEGRLPALPGVNRSN